LSLFLNLLFENSSSSLAFKFFIVQLMLLEDTYWFLSFHRICSVMLGFMHLWPSFCLGVSAHCVPLVRNSPLIISNNVAAWLCFRFLSLDWWCLAQ
jgi:hypothetical protein